GPDGKEQGGWGIHGTLNKEFLGHALSKGCIRMAPEEAKELKEKIPIGTPLKNIYEIFGFDGELLEIRTDIYNLVKDPESKIKEMLPEQRFLNKVKLEKILEEMEKRKKIYIKTCMELYKKYIRPLDDNKPHPDLIKKYPEIKNYLKTMEENKKLVIELKEILL
ncbi:MAG: L,D-transpeptidase family protein, partial [Candidatus Aenigmatarchaeota archaeon]